MFNFLYAEEEGEKVELLLQNKKNCKKYKLKTVTFANFMSET